MKFIFVFMLVLFFSPSLMAQQTNVMGPEDVFVDPNNVITANPRSVITDGVPSRESLTPNSGVYSAQLQPYIFNPKLTTDPYDLEGTFKEMKSSLGVGSGTRRSTASSIRSSYGQGIFVND